jgi:hypothetical protein
MEQHDICAILDVFTEGGPVCGHTGLFRGGAAAMRAAICECADDLREAEELLREGDTPEVAVLILRRVADECQQFARTTDIAIRTGAARCANSSPSSRSLPSAGAQIPTSGFRGA